MANLFYRSHPLLSCEKLVGTTRLAVTSIVHARKDLAAVCFNNPRLRLHASLTSGALVCFRARTCRQSTNDLSNLASRHKLISKLQAKTTNSIRALSNAPKPPKPPSLDPVDQLHQTESHTQPPLTTRLASASKDVKDQVKSSLTSLTPRENIYNLPNLLTVSRLFAAPLTAYLVLHDHHGWALAVFAYAGITDLVDGWMARKWKLQTVAGSVIDPMADKALMIILTVTLAVKASMPAYLAALILGRDASLALAAIWYRYASLPAPKTMARYWDFSLPSAEVHPTTVSKYNTFLQIILIGSTLALPVVTADSHHLGVLHDLGLGNVDLHQAMLGLQVIVAGTTLWSGLSYAFLKNAVTILGTNEKLKARQGAIGRAIIGVTFGAVVVAAGYLAVVEPEKKDAITEDASR